VIFVNKLLKLSHKNSLHKSLAKNFMPLWFYDMPHVIY
jgi:hypothetical protein